MKITELIFLAHRGEQVQQESDSAMRDRWKANLINFKKEAQLREVTEKLIGGETDRKMDIQMDGWWAFRHL